MDPTIASAPTPSATPGAPPLGEFDRWDFLWKTHSYLNDYIRFADTKAGIIMALSTALLGGLVASKVHHWCGPSRLDLENPDFRATVVGSGAFSAFALLIVAFCFAVLALAPRLWVQKVRGLADTVKHWFKGAPDQRAQPSGFIFWAEILQFPDGDAYWQGVKGATKSSMEEHLAKRLHDLSALTDEKYLCVNRSIIFFLLGAIVAGLCIIGAS